jgi:hypothetical protein
MCLLERLLAQVYGLPPVLVAALEMAMALKDQGTEMVVEMETVMVMVMAIIMGMVCLT